MIKHKEFNISIVFPNVLNIWPNELNLWSVLWPWLPYWGWRQICQNFKFTAMKDILTTLNASLPLVSLLHSAVKLSFSLCFFFTIISKIFEDIYTKIDWSYLANCDRWCVGYWLLDRLGLKCWFDVDLSLTSWLEIGQQLQPPRLTQFNKH